MVQSLDEGIAVVQAELRPVRRNDLLQLVPMKVKLRQHWRDDRQPN
jgi:hypothetical protein